MTEPNEQQHGGSEHPSRKPVYGRENLELGFDEDGSGYIVVENRETTYEFTVSEEEVREFHSELGAERPELPQRPEGAIDDDEVSEVPDDWVHRGVVHTGGGFWTRIFYKEYNSHRIEVAYRPTDLSGVSLGFYEEGQWYHEIDHVTLDSSDPTETEALTAAKALMLQVEIGAYQIPPEGVDS